MALGVDWVVDLDDTRFDTDGYQYAKQNQSKKQLLHRTPGVYSRLAICRSNPLALRRSDRKRSQNAGGEAEEM